MPYRLSYLLATIAVAFALSSSAAQAKPFWGYNASQGACPVYSWNSSGTDCADTTKINQQRLSLTGNRPAVYRMRAQYNICEAYIAAGQDCFKFFDKTIAWAAQHNQKVLLIVTQSNNSGADYNGWRFPQTTSELARYQEWWRKLGVKYGNDSRVIGAEVWNEPNGNTVFTGGLNVTPAMYAKGVCAALAGRNVARTTTGSPRLKLYYGALAWNTSGITTPSLSYSPSGYMGTYLAEVTKALKPVNGCPDVYLGPIDPAEYAQGGVNLDRADGVTFHMYNSPQIDWGAPIGAPYYGWRSSGTAANPCENDAVTGYEQVNGCNLALSMTYHALWLENAYSMALGGTIGEVLITEVGYLGGPAGGMPSTWQSQRWAMHYIKQYARDVLTGYQFRGVYLYPLQSQGGNNGSDIEQAGLWRTDFTANPQAAEFNAALQDQINNPTLYP